MLSAVPDMLPAMKRLIDDGYALPFAEAMAPGASGAWRTGRG